MTSLDKEREREREREGIWKTLFYQQLELGLHAGTKELVAIVSSPLRLLLWSSNLVVYWILAFLEISQL